MMKRIAVAHLITWLCGMGLAFSQDRLASSLQGSGVCLIYKLRPENLRDVYLKGHSVDESLLHTQVGQFLRGQEIPVLPRGNYMIVRTEGNQLSFTEHIVDDLLFDLVPGKRVMLLFYDSLGNMVRDAQVRRRVGKIPFDEKTQTYSARKLRDGQVIEVEHTGVYHYIEFEKGQRYDNPGFWQRVGYQIRYGWRRWLPRERSYSGFMVFSKPRYKSNELVQLKAYVSDGRGKPYSRALDVRLRNHSLRLDTVLARLEPYRPGMYAYAFRLTDSLKLRLDQPYEIVLQTTDAERKYTLSGGFRHEEYELKSLRFTIGSERSTYTYGDSIKLTLKATDENDMAVYDGRAEIVVVPDRAIGRSVLKGVDSAFVPDTLWRQQVDMSGLSEKEILLPDSTFPQGVSTAYEVKATFLNADNEKVEASRAISFEPVAYRIDFSVEKGLLRIEQWHNGKSLPGGAQLIVRGKEGAELYRDSIDLPYGLPLHWAGTTYEVNTIHTQGSYEVTSAGDVLLPNMYRLNDSVFVHVDNPSGIPFWYHIRRGKTDIAYGRADSLRFAGKDAKGTGYAVYLSYILGDEAKTQEQALPFSQKNITLEVEASTVVYPGQQSQITAIVNDWKGRPVADADITAYAYTTKFDQNTPSVRSYGKARYAKRFKNTVYDADEYSMTNRNVEMDWNRWRGLMGLDTIAYYEFLYPEDHYLYSRPAPGGITQFSPYVVVDGRIEGVHLLWIDGVLRYIKQAQQLDRYVFDVEPGIHTVRMRTADRDVVVANLPLFSSRHTILSVNAKAPRADSESAIATRVTVLKKRKDRLLSESDAREANEQAISMDTHFGQLQLPGLATTIDLPAYFRIGAGYYYLNPARQVRYDYRLGGDTYMPKVFGPLRTGVYPLFVDTVLINQVAVTGSHHHTVYRGYQRLWKWEKPLIGNFLASYAIDRVDFSHFLLTKADIQDHFDEQLQNQLLNNEGEAGSTLSVNDPRESARLTLRIGNDHRNNSKRPRLILLTYAAGSEHLLYYGGSRSFRDLPTGEATMTLVYGDSLAYSFPLWLRSNGQHIVDVDSLPDHTGLDSLAILAYRLFNERLKKVFAESPVMATARKRGNTRYNRQPVEDVGSFNPENLAGSYITGTVRNAEGNALPGVWISLRGMDAKVVTDEYGRFLLRGGRPGDLLFSAIGYESVTAEWREGFDYDIVMNEAMQQLDEVVVTGYGTSRKKALASMSAMLQGKVAGVSQEGAAANVGSIRLRGTNSTSVEQQPLIIVNGLPYSGRLEDLDPSQITSVQILKDASATAIYGARAANGVIFIDTKGAVKGQQAAVGDGEMLMQDVTSSMRRNFHDDAFWQPRLRTDAQGKAVFEVTYPDDVTSWNANFIAVGKRKQTDAKQLIIKSFKSLSARLSAPRFARRGDSLAAVGKLANHLPDTVSVIRTVAVDGETIDEKEVSLAKSHTDQVPVYATDGDSLVIAYSLRRSNGFFDGEELRLPILEPGLKVAKGEFVLFGDTTTRTIRMDPSLGAVTVHAEAKGLDVLLREVETIQRYPYFCNEQLASKLKALLAKKMVLDTLGRPFDEDRQIEKLINRLMRNVNDQGGWGWWDKGQTVSWITLHIAEALIAAERTGFTIDWGKKKLAEHIERELHEVLDRLSLSVNNHPLAKRTAIDHLLLLKAVDAPVDYKRYYKAIASLPDLSVRDQLRSMQVAVFAGERDHLHLDSLLGLSRKTMLGNRYWGEEPVAGMPRFLGWVPYATDTENTLLAYGLLQALGVPVSIMREVQFYFFEQRKNDAWENTYTASRILEALLPTMLRDSEKLEPVSLRINDQQVAQFPYTATFDTQELHIHKSGTFPLFFTAYQEAWLSRPTREANGFRVNSAFGTNGDSVAVLQSGTPVELTVSVNLDDDANYVLIEVPIPAGCSYEARDRNVSWETYREYEKDNVLICCDRLPKGEHRFVVKLLPRFNGRYTLNPARAQLMYFPTFHGHEALKQVLQIAP